MVDKKNAIAILEELREGIAPLRKHSNFGSPEFKKWQLDTQTAIETIFPLKAGHVHRFNSIVFKGNAYRVLHRPDATTSAFQDGLNEAEAILRSMTDEIRKYWDENGTSEYPQKPHLTALKIEAVGNNPTPVVTTGPDVIFVIHGRNGALRNSMFEFLRAIGLKPLEFSQATSATEHGSPYVGQILDAAFSKAKAVVVLMTPDDEVRLKPEFQSDRDSMNEKQLTGQARPNVLFEAGMAMGRDASRTVLVEVGRLRPFSDIGGRHVIHLDNSTERRQDLAERLKSSGCAVDLSGRDWHKVGSFVIQESKHLTAGPEPERNLMAGFTREPPEPRG
jgi:predicted nucleotide-binding protein